MERNKDYAITAKEIAEKKFAEKDVAGAKQFALKAQNLYPDLDGLPQFLAVLDVYISTERRVNGVIDWYGVLGVDPSADDDTIRKHYRKLALILYPDNNKSIGADGAFKIVSAAWSLLSDKFKRSVYDQKLNLRGTHESVPTGQNGFQNHSNDNGQNSCYWKSFIHPKPTPVPPVKQTFWTICNTCRVQFEYSRVFLNNNLVCSNCRSTFLAMEKPPPPLNVNSSSSPLVPIVRQHDPSPHIQMKSSYDAEKIRSFAANMRRNGLSDVKSLVNGFESGSLFKTGAAKNVQAPASLVTQASDVIEPASGKLKSGHKVESQLEEIHVSEMQCSASSFKGDRPQKKRCISESWVYGNDAIQKAMGNARVAKGSRRELSQVEVRNMLMAKATNEITKKLSEWKMPAISTTTKKSKTSRKDTSEERGAKKATFDGVKVNANICRDGENPGADSDLKGSDPFSMIVPDPDFHDFDKDRTERSFGNNQVWAVYDDDDGMPRYYAMVHSVISMKPFKLRISWLNSKSNNELAPLNWVGCGFPKTSGDFWIGKHEVNHFLNSFSHRIRWTKGSRGAIHIFPMKKDVWALYRNWSSEWNELTPDEVIHKYDMVEVVEDYNEASGVAVAPLVKVVGFKTVFQRHSDPSKIRAIPREEMFRFSHQVPSYLLTGLEGQNAPAGCLELDPAATPLELLQVTKESEENIVETTAKGLLEDGGENTGGDTVINKEANELKMIVYSRKRYKGSENAGGCSD